MQIQESIRVSADPVEALAYAANFRHLPEWDWSATRAEQLAGDGAHVGAFFRVHLGIGPFTTTLGYEITEYEPGRRAVLVSRGEQLVSEDTIEVEPSGSGTRLTYSARLEAAGLPGALDAVLAQIFALHGHHVLSRLAEQLARPAARVA